MSNFNMQGGAEVSFYSSPSDAHGRVWCKCWRIHVMADIFLRFKLRVEISDNEIRSCI